MPGKSKLRQAIEAEASAVARLPERQCSAVICKRATEFALLGASNGDIAAFLGIDISMFERWTVEKPAFRRALQKGRELGDVRVARALHRRATGFTAKARKVVMVAGEPQVVEYDEEIAGDVTAQRFWLTNKRPGQWRERTGAEAGQSIDLVALVNALHERRGDNAKVVDGTATVDEAEGPSAERNE